MRTPGIDPRLEGITPHGLKEGIELIPDPHTRELLRREKIDQRQVRHCERFFMEACVLTKTAKTSAYGLRSSIEKWPDPANHTFITAGAGITAAMNLGILLKPYSTLSKDCKVAVDIHVPAPVPRVVRSGRMRGMTLSAACRPTKPPRPG
jgi:hypothetical protein